MSRYLAWLLLVLTTPALAGVVLDQSYGNFSTADPNLAVGGSSQQKLAQTFTAGISAELSHVSLILACGESSPGLVTIALQGVAPGGEPDGAVLASISLPAASLSHTLDDYTDFSLPGPWLTAGDEYAIVITADDSASCSLRGGQREGSWPPLPRYDDGEAWFDVRPNPPGWLAIDDVEPEPFDLVFKQFVFDGVSAGGPRFCDFQVPSGDPDDPWIDNTWIPNDVPLCGCASDPVLARNRCWFVTPDLMLWRDLPWPGDIDTGVVQWQGIAWGSPIKSLKLQEFAPDGDFKSQPISLQLPKAGAVSSAKAKFWGAAKQTRVQLRYEGQNGPVIAEFITGLPEPKARR